MRRDCPGNLFEITSSLQLKDRGVNVAYSSSQVGCFILVEIFIKEFQPYISLSIGFNHVYLHPCLGKWSNLTIWVDIFPDGLKPPTNSIYILLDIRRRVKSWWFCYFVTPKRSINLPPVTYPHQENKALMWPYYIRETNAYIISPYFWGGGRTLREVSWPATPNFHGLQGGCQVVHPNVFLDPLPFLDPQKNMGTNGGFTKPSKYGL